MNSTCNLSKMTDYAEDRVSIKSVTLENFVTTDNLLQNKQGLGLAANLPPQQGNMPAFKRNDILVGNIRPYLKKIWFADRDGGCSADVLVFRVKEKYDPKFVYYGMYRDDFFSHMMRGSKGTKMPRGDKNQIMAFTLPQLEKPIQERIAAVLSALDAKIEINTRINTQLEAMAKTLYDYWFVQFDFPDENGKPYKSTGGKMVYNETLKREIPDGWEVKELYEIANITMGQSPSGASFNEDGIGLIFYQGSTDFGWLFPSVRQYTTSPTRHAKKHDILLSVRAPVGDINIADAPCSIGRGLAALHSRHGFDGYLFYVMKYFQSVFERKNKDGTTFGSITKEGLHSLNVVNPPTGLMKQFNLIVSMNNRIIFLKHQENQKLAELRDWLLPMLMNGQVRVEDTN